MIKLLFVVLISLIPASPSRSVCKEAYLPDASWVCDLKEQFSRIENNMSGNLGVYVKYLGDNRTLSYKADEYWYLASTTKIPMAVAILQKVESGSLSLDDKLVLQESNFVDGAGDLLWQKPGTEYTIASLMERMIQSSDNCATDMLFGLIGEDELDLRIRQTMIPQGLNRITSILQVRYDAFSEFHENALGLSNMDILYVNSTRSRTERLQRLLERMSVYENELKARTIEEAFELYYERRLNSGNLESMGLLLERLYAGELLSDKHTRLLLDIMKGVTTGERRIKAGLGEGWNFAHKTGTQIRRTVNVGIIYPGDNRSGYPIIVAASVEKTDNLIEAEKALEEVGRVLYRALMQQGTAL
jgi:beta-lactamase class A